MKRRNLVIPDAVGKIVPSHGADGKICRVFALCISGLEWGLWRLAAGVRWWLYFLVVWVGVGVVVVGVCCGLWGGVDSRGCCGVVYCIFSYFLFCGLGIRDSFGDF
jgi:hypothetical protein